jgi:hypothetical protein
VLLIPHVFLTYSHHLYLTVWLEQGLLGMMGVLLLVAAFGHLIARETSTHRPGALFDAAWVGGAVIFVHGLFDARQYVDLWTMWPMYVLMGLTVSLSTVESRRTAAKLSWRWIVLGTGLAALSMVILWRPVVSLVFSNLGATKQAKAQLAEGLGEQARAQYLEEAVASYERALSVDPNNLTANLRMGVLAMDRGQYGRAVDLLEAGLEAGPSSPAARKAMGLGYVWVGEVDRAASLLVDVPEIVSELNTWGWWHAEHGRSQLAIYAYHTSLTLEPSQPQIRDAIAQLEND